MLKNLLLEAVEYKITETPSGAWRRVGIEEYVCGICGERHLKQRNISESKLMD